MTPFQQQLHTEHRERLARFAQAAMAKKAKPAAVEPLPVITLDQFREAHELLDRQGIINGVEVVQRAVLKRFYGVTLSDLKSGRRTAKVVLPRQIAMYICRHTTSKSFPDIGRRFGDRDHTTVLSAVNKIERLRKADPEIDALVKSIAEEIGGCVP
jgi:chromosomal replication initiation ATPase DnaA